MPPLKKSRTPNLNLTSLLVFAIILAGVVMIVGFVRAQPPSGVPGLGGGGTKYDATQAENLVTTNSTTFEDMPGLLVSFNSTGNKPAVILFNAHTLHINNDNSVNNCSFFYRFNIDQNSQSSEILADSDVNFTHNFVSQPLNPGPHTVKIEWRTDQSFGGALSCALQRSLVVLHE